MDGPDTLDERPEPRPPVAPDERSTNDDADARVAEAEDRWRRAAADLDNSRKRALRDVDDARREERVRVARSFLPMVDDLERALDFAPDADEQYLVVIDAVLLEAIRTLTRLGYPRIDQTGVPFDPAEHEVVSVTRTSTIPPNTVVKVERAGYGTPGHVLRPAAVVVAAPEQ
jgi:molecular chaperone GrpE